MRKILLMTSAVVLFPLSTVAQTTCTASPDCASLGYTEASCPNGGVKCPWGDKWFCSSSETEICSKYGFNYTCSGTGYAGGAGSACGGKYASCNCGNDYKWENGRCIELPWGKCTGIAAQCSLGDILFSDGSCSTNKVTGKTPIAVVAYKSSDGKCGQALALESIGSFKWSSDCVDLSRLPNYSSEEEASKDYDSCGNTAKIIEAGNNNKYPAAWAAHSYSTTGTKVGDWCLPAAGIFTSYYNNQDAVNAGLDKVGGTKFLASNSYTRAWSSSEEDEDSVWYSYFNSNYLDNYGLSSYYYLDKDSVYEVRPVIEF